MRDIHQSVSNFSLALITFVFVQFPEHSEKVLLFLTFDSEQRAQVVSYSYRINDIDDPSLDLSAARFPTLLGFDEL